MLFPRQENISEKRQVIGHIKEIGKQWKKQAAFIAKIWSEKSLKSIRRFLLEIATLQLLIMLFFD